MPQSAGGNNHIGAAQGYLKSISNHCRIIANGDFAGEANINFTQAARNIGGIRIEDVADEEFRADADNFNFHVCYYCGVSFQHLLH
jgi:hypothetical protein